MKIELTLATHAGELDRQVIEVKDYDDENIASMAVTYAVRDAIACWVLNVGDVIAIREG